jgi:putative ubiquitin-RnfH superfamily antitoxin RatB of RatAB toxin-antitoxin module
MAAPASINIEVVLGLPGRQKLIPLTVDSAITVAEAIQKSGIAEEFPEQDINSCKVGIWGRVVQANQTLREGDRIEIYRPLTIDPRDARRQLAEHGGFMGRAGMDGDEG